MSQEWARAGPMMFALASTCTDVEHGCMTFKLPPSMVKNDWGETDRNVKISMAPQSPESLENLLNNPSTILKHLDF